MPSNNNNKYYYSSNFSPEFRDLIEKMLAYNEEERLSIK